MQVAGDVSGETGGLVEVEEASPTVGKGKEDLAEGGGAETGDQETRTAEANCLDPTRNSASTAPTGWDRPSRPSSTSSSPRVLSRRRWWRSRTERRT